jgi:hypothetical protein
MTKRDLSITDKELINEADITLMGVNHDAPVNVNCHFEGTVGEVTQEQGPVIQKKLTYEDAINLHCKIITKIV